MLQRAVLYGMTTGEIALTALLVAIVIIAPKIPRIGETIGGWFERR